MKNVLKTTILIGFFAAAGVLAESIHEYAGTTSASFLKINVGARPVALGETYAAVSDDAYGVLWNPAGASKIDVVEYAFSYNKWLSDIGKEIVMVSLPQKSSSTISFGMMYLHVPEMTKSDIYGNTKGKFNAYSLAALLSYSKQFNANYSAGATFKFLQEGIDTEKATGFCFDFGGMYTSNDERFTAGVSLLNIGPNMKFIKDSFELPRTLKLGGAYRFSRYNSLLLADVSKAIGENTRYSIGAEFNPYKILLLRGGYNTRGSVTAGFGFVYKMFHFDYAFVPFGDLGYTHRVSIRLKFNYVPKIKRIKRMDKKPKDPALKKSSVFYDSINYIYGTIVDIDKNPVENATVKILQNDEERIRVMCYPVNTYQTPDLPLGRYEIKAWKTGYLPEFRNVELKEGEPLQLNFEFIPLKDSNYVYGKITDKDGKPMEGVIVDVTQMNKEVLQMTTGPNGVYGSTELSFGNYTLKVSKDGYKLKRVFFKISKGRPTQVDIKLNPLKPVSESPEQ